MERWNLDKIMKFPLINLSSSSSSSSSTHLSWVMEDWPVQDAVENTVVDRLNKISHLYYISCHGLLSATKKSKHSKRHTVCSQILLFQIGTVSYPDPPKMTFINLQFNKIKLFKWSIGFAIQNRWWLLIKFWRPSLKLWTTD